MHRYESGYYHPNGLFAFSSCGKIAVSREWSKLSIVLFECKKRKDQSKNRNHIASRTDTDGYIFVIHHSQRDDLFFSSTVHEWYGRCPAAKDSISDFILILFKNLVVRMIKKWLWICYHSKPFSLLFVFMIKNSKWYAIWNEYSIIFN